MKPFKLQPEYREYIWGGKRIRLDAERIAEAWIVYENNVIADGLLAGLTLGEAAKREGAPLLGTRAVEKTSDKFPLLIKILDCAEWLSLQVHPNNAQAEYWEGPNRFGKMEGWYVIEADADAQLISGFQNGVTRDMIQSSVGKKALLDIVNWWNVKSGDAILIEPGTLHALGPGTLVYEVQQTSDLTYRVYDWDRPMKAGRKLHLEQAADVLNPDAEGGLKHLKPGFSGEKELLSCGFFNLRMIKNAPHPIHLNTNGESFHCLTMAEGSGEIEGDGWRRSLDRFETLVIPAACGEFQTWAKNAVCLDAFVP